MANSLKITSTKFWQFLKILDLRGSEILHLQTAYIIFSIRYFYFENRAKVDMCLSNNLAMG